MADGPNASVGRAGRRKLQFRDFDKDPMKQSVDLPAPTEGSVSAGTVARLRGRGKARPAPAREMSAEDLNAMVLDQIAGRRAEESDPMRAVARSNIDRVMGGGMKAGGPVKSKGGRGDGIATKGKTKGRMC